MGALLAARMGDQVGNHGSGLFAGLGMGLGLIAGAVIGAALIVATGGAALVVAAAVAGAICITAAAGAAGERLGESYDNDVAVGTPCSMILMGCPTVFIESMLAARMNDPTSACLITEAPALMQQGSQTVFVGGVLAARHNDLATCTGSAIPQTKHTYIGGPPAMSGVPSQATTAALFHDMGSALEDEAKWAGYTALALGGAEVAVVGVTACLAASAAGAGLTAVFGAGVLAAAPGAAGLGIGYFGSVEGAKGGAFVGSLIDSAAGTTDGRFARFGSTWGGIAGGAVGGKIAEASIDAGGSSSEEANGTADASTEQSDASADNTLADVVAEDEEASDTVPRSTAESSCQTCSGDGSGDASGDDSAATDPVEPTDPTALSAKAQSIVDGLTPEMQADIAASPKLRKQLNDLANRGENSWDIKLNGTKRGADANREARAITIGSGYEDVNVLAHEVGHAQYDVPDQIPADPSMTRDQYVQQNLDQHLIDEGEAQFNEFEIRQDILDNGGRDIGNRGDVAAQEIYERFRRGEVSRDDAVRQMGQGFRNKPTSTSGENYGDFYSASYKSYWDESYEPWLKSTYEPSVEAQKPTIPPNSGADVTPAAVGKACTTCGGAEAVPNASDVIDQVESDVAA
jgi:uncharacterized Zn-binding protein involved in type VI secretion